MILSNIVGLMVKLAFAAAERAFYRWANHPFNCNFANHLVAWEIAFDKNCESIQIGVNLGMCCKFSSRVGVLSQCPMLDYHACCLAAAEKKNWQF